MRIRFSNGTFSAYFDFPVHQRRCEPLWSPQSNTKVTLSKRKPRDSQATNPLEELIILLDRTPSERMLEAKRQSNELVIVEFTKSQSSKFRFQEPRKDIIRTAEADPF